MKQFSDRYETIQRLISPIIHPPTHAAAYRVAALVAQIAFLLLEGARGIGHSTLKCAREHPEEEGTRVDGKLLLDVLCKLGQVEISGVIACMHGVGAGVSRWWSACTA